MSAGIGTGVGLGSADGEEIWSGDRWVSVGPGSEVGEGEATAVDGDGDAVGVEAAAQAPAMTATTAMARACSRAFLGLIPVLLVECPVRDPVGIVCRTLLRLIYPSRTSTWKVLSSGLPSRPRSQARRMPSSSNPALSATRADASFSGWV